MVFYYCQTKVLISCWVELWIIIFLRFNLEFEYDRDAFCGDTERLIVICLRKNSVSPFFRVFPTFSATHLSRCCCFFSPRSFSSFSRRKLITQHSTATAHLLGWDYYIIFCVFIYFFPSFLCSSSSHPSGRVTSQQHHGLRPENSRRIYNLHELISVQKWRWERNAFSQQIDNNYSLWECEEWRSMKPLTRVSVWDDDGGRRELSACQWQWLYFRSTRERIQLFVQRFLFLVRLKIDLKIVIKQNATLIIVNREWRDEWVKISSV